MSRVERHAAEEAAIRASILQEEAEKNENGGGEPKRKKHKRRLTPLGRFLDILGTLIMIAALLVSLGLTVPRFTGIQSYVVVSGSMEPAIPVGSLVYAKPVEPKTLKTGDVIVFFSKDAASGGTAQSGASPITHRVVENRVDEGEIITKGDANNANDISPASYRNVVGKVIAHVPELGYLASPLASLQGKIALVLIILAGFLLTEAGGRMKR